MSTPTVPTWKHEYRRVYALMRRTDIQESKKISNLALPAKPIGITLNGPFLYALFGQYIGKLHFMIMRGMMKNTSEALMPGQMEFAVWVPAHDDLVMYGVTRADGSAVDIGFTESLKSFGECIDFTIRFNFAKQQAVTLQDVFSMFIMECQKREEAKLPAIDDKYMYEDVIKTSSQKFCVPVSTRLLQLAGGVEGSLFDYARIMQMVHRCVKTGDEIDAFEDVYYHCSYHVLIKGASVQQNVVLSPLLAPNLIDPKADEQVMMQATIWMPNVDDNIDPRSFAIRMFMAGATFGGKHASLDEFVSMLDRGTKFIQDWLDGVSLGALAKAVTTEEAKMTTAAAAKDADHQIKSPLGKHPRDKEKKGAVSPVLVDKPSVQFTIQGSASKRLKLGDASPFQIDVCTQKVGQHPATGAAAVASAAARAAEEDVSRYYAPVAAADV